jgi:hypothetical protein
LETGNLQVRNDILAGGSLLIGGGASIGTGGLLSYGTLSVVASTTATELTSAAFGNRVAIGTSTPISRLTIWSGGTGTRSAFTAVNSASSTLFTILDNSRVGIGTTTPDRALAVHGEVLVAGTTTVSGVYATSSVITPLISVTGSATSSFTGGITASALGLTGGLTLSGGSLLVTSTATSTWSGGLSVTGLTVTGGMIVSGGSLNVTSTASSTWAGGINLTGGCFAINGVCLAAPAGSVGSGNANQIAYYSNSTNLAGAGGLNWDNTLVRLGIGTSTQGATLSVQDSAVVSGQLNVPGLTATGTTLLALGSANINNPQVGFGSTSPWGFVSIEPATTTVGANTPIFVIGDQGTTTSFFLVSGNNGNIGVGSTTPWAQLSINNIAGASNPLFTVGTSTAFQTGVTQTALIIDSLGRIGIGGTTSPSEQLTVQGNIANIRASSSPIRFISSLAVSTNIVDMEVAGNYAYTVSDSGTSAFRIYDITNPLAPAQIYAGAPSLGAVAIGVSLAIEVVGSRAYIFGFDVGGSSSYHIFVVDISNPASPILVGNFNTGYASAPMVSAEQFKVYGSRAYIGVSGVAPTELRIYDVSSNAPYLLSSFVPRDTFAVQAIEVWGNYLYTVDGEVSLRIYDVSNPNRPQETGYYWLGTTNITTYGSQLVYPHFYMAGQGSTAEEGKLFSFDVSDPFSPKLLDRVDIFGNNQPQTLSVMGRYAYTTNYFSVRAESFIEVFDVSNPKNLRSIGIFASPTEASVPEPRAFKILGRYGYLVDRSANAKLWVVDVGGLETTSAYIHSLDAGNAHIETDVKVVGGAMIFGSLGSGSAGLLSAGPISVLATSTAFEVRSASFIGKVGVASTSPWGFLSVEALGGTVSTATPTFVVGDSGTGTPMLLVHGGFGNVGVGSTTPWAQLSINNLGGATAPLFAVSTSTAVASGWGTSLVIGASGNVGIGGTTSPTEALTVRGNILNIASSSTPPRLVGRSLGPSQLPGDVYVSGMYAYVVDEGVERLLIFDVSTTSPAFVSEVTTDTDPQSVFVDGKYAYIANLTSNSFQIFDVSRPSAPRLVTSTTTISRPTYVFVSGGYAYLTNQPASGNGVMQIYNIASSTPELVSATGIGLGGSVKVVVQDKFAYVADFSNPGTLRIYDVSNPRAPAQTGTLSIGAAPVDMEISGKYLYVLNRDADNLQAIDISDPYNPRLMSTITVDDLPLGVAVYGRYVFVGSYNAGTVQTYDFIDPTSPKRIAKFADRGGALGTQNGLFANGRYLYVVDGVFVSTYLQKWDMGGLESTAGIIHSLDAGSVQLRNDLAVAGNFSIGNSLTVGNGGILSHGPISVMATSTLVDKASAFFGNNVGIGTSTPYGRLSIQNNDATFPALLVRADGAGLGNVAISVDSFTGPRRDSCRDNNGVTANGPCALNDIAELFEANPEVEVADIVTMDSSGHKLIKASYSSSTPHIFLAGIISTAPAIVFEGSGLKTMGGVYSPVSGKLPLALSGRVPVKVDLEGGPIKIGDPITASSKPGIGKKADRSGRIVGYALTPFNGPTEENDGKIIVLVDNSFWMASDVPDIFNEPQMGVENLDSFKDWLTSLEINIEKGFIKVREIVVDIFHGENITTSEVLVNKFEIIDSATGEKFCVTIVPDTAETSTPVTAPKEVPWQKTKGECSISE